MKQKDITLIVVVTIFAGVFSLLISKYIITPSDSLTASAEVVKPITSEFIIPDPRYFNTESNNPTQIIRIGEGTNDNPFSTGTN